MANTITIADKERGYIKITKRKIENLIDKVQNSEYEGKEELLSILNRWLQGDFSQAVADHNYVWTLLNGEVGRAHSADEKEIEVTRERVLND